MDGKFYKYVAKVTEIWNFTEIHKYLRLSYCCCLGVLKWTTEKNDYSILFFSLICLCQYYFFFYLYMKD